MKIVVFCIFCTLFNNFELLAQSDSSGNKFKHELGIQIGPIVSVALGGSNNSQPYGLVWKMVKGKLATRVGYFYGNRPISAEKTRTEVINDLLLERGFERRHQAHILTIGAEYRYPLGKGLQWQFGFEATARFLNQQFRISELTSEIDTIINPGSGNEVIIPKFMKNSRFFDQTSRGLHYGLSVSTGVLLPVYKKFWLSGQIRIDSHFGKLRQKSQDFLLNSENVSYVNSFNVDVNGLLSELAVYYRF